MCMVEGGGGFSQMTHASTFCGDACVGGGDAFRKPTKREILEDGAGETGKTGEEGRGLANERRTLLVVWRRCGRVTKRPRN